MKERLIDANALIDKRCSTCCLRKTCANRYEKDGKQYVCGDIKNIVNAPTIEAEPVRNAHWETWGFVFHGIEWKRCSACGKCADVSYYGILDGKIKMSTPARCGCCGAEMDDEEVQDDAEHS